ncbi:MULTISPECIES: alanyl-tRNA editing protein [Oxalobacteraceae]|jgi:alanyl-tRNA synthetase|uniref:alanyl-tRNA editing protein n=1 Tax=Oxalobacteraceae TaxID=75682 RepID=UPI002BE4EE5E|nr:MULTISPECIES: alanyl-tRNA editing protein [Oxalobacteraceae]HTD04085.1 alanyl-tRNA editing protein [Undibacterium sp.]HWW05553.1 alanyl-tRNA editing protein [Collimonas sp.]
MTHKLFWQDPYRTTLKTRVVAVDNDRIRLAETIFFAFSGGQESDHGSLAGHPVLSAEKNGLDILYTLAPGHGLQAGSEVEILIDWERRHRLMRLHFAAEMVLQLVCQLRPGIERIGSHISADKSRIDFAYEGSIAELFPQIETEVAALLQADLPIVTAFTDEAAQRRYWEVAGFAKMACGGTHPRSTAEVGALKLKRKNIGKGKERIEISLIESAG